VQIVFVNAFHMNLWDDVKLYRSKKKPSHRKCISLPISLAPETLDGLGCLPLRPGTLLGQSKYEKTSLTSVYGERPLRQIIERICDFLQYIHWHALILFITNICFFLKLQFVSSKIRIKYLERYFECTYFLFLCSICDHNQ